MRQALSLLFAPVLASSLFFSAPAFADAAKAVAHAPAPVASAQPDESHAQPVLAKEPLVIVTHDGQRHLLHVEMALTQDQQTVGLMWRKMIPSDGGMLFDWGYPRESDMWMKNTVSSLDMLFIGQDGAIRHIAENTVPQSLANISSGGPVRAALELPAGTAERMGIQVGDHIEQRIFTKSGS